MIALWVALALVATPDTLRLPTLKLGRFVIYGLDTLHLQRETVEAYPRVVYTPDPGTPTLPAGFFQAPTDLATSLPLPSPGVYRPLLTGTQAYLLPTFGGAVAGLGLRAGGRRWHAEGRLLGSHWTPKRGLKQILNLWSRLGVGDQSLELWGATWFWTGATYFFCEYQERPAWGALRARLQASLGALHLQLQPWGVGMYRWVHSEGIECISRDTSWHRLAVGARLRGQLPLGTPRWLYGEAAVYHGSDSLFLEALAGLGQWLPWGRLRVDLGAARTSSGLWYPLGHLEFLQPVRRGAQGISLYRQILYPGDVLPLPALSPDLFQFPVIRPTTLLETWLAPWWHEGCTLDLASRKTGGALWLHRQRTGMQLTARLGAERVENWRLPGNSHRITSSLGFLRVALHQQSSLEDLLVAAGLQIAWEDSTWPFMLGLFRFRYFWKPDTWFAVQMRSLKNPTLDLWLQHRLKGRVWAAAGVWNLLQEASLLPQDFRLFAGLWWNTFETQGGSP